MSSPTTAQPATLGLFGQRFAGDDSLMALARLRFKQAAMGTEIHAHAPEHLDWLLGLRPWPDAPVVVHLPRDWDLLQENTRSRIAELCSHAAGKVIGCVLHDQKAMVETPDQYLAAVRQMNERLGRIDHCPVLFIEYAVGLEPASFVEFWRSVGDLSHIATCIDIGHVGIRAARAAYLRLHQGEDICALKDQPPALVERMGDVQNAVACGLSTVLQLVDQLSAMAANKRLHFHLHDGHPLSSFSPFGVADHLSFFADIPLNFEYRGRRSVPPMFGPTGLTTVLERAFKNIDAERLSFTLEIHPTQGRQALADAASLFLHWTDKTNAELMNHWLGILVRNHELLLESIRQVASPSCT